MRQGPESGGTGRGTRAGRVPTDSAEMALVATVLGAVMGTRLDSLERCGLADEPQGARRAGMADLAFEVCPS
jgi:hypothetical protein